MKLWTGDDATSRAITGLNFSPDLLWIKSRSSSGWHALADSVRGAGKILASNSANSEYDNTDSQNAIQSFDSNGFTIGDQGSWLVNDNNITTVGWAWDAGSSNTSISAGGLNSSIFDQSRNWSGGSTSGQIYSGSWSQVFNNVETNSYSDGNSVYVYQNTATLDFATALPSGAIQIWGRVGSSGSSGDKVTFSDGTNTYTTGDLSNQTAKWIDVNSGSSLSGITSVTVHSGGSSGAGMVLGAIRIGGKKLVDSSVSVGNVPSIATTVRANPSYGFSISKASVAASLTGGPTVAHGLQKKPEFIIGKNIDSTIYWYAYHKDLTNEHYLIPHLTSGEQHSNAVWGNHDSLDANQIQIGAGTPASMWIPSGTHDCIFYAWTSIEGFCKIGSFINPSSSDGAFVNLGFKPALIFAKCAINISSSNNLGDWVVKDSSRSPFNNPSDGNTLIWNEAYAEDNYYSASQVAIDILSNGFKIRHPNSSPLGDPGRRYVFAAWAENPFASNNRAG